MDDYRWLPMFWGFLVIDWLLIDRATYWHWSTWVLALAPLALLLLVTQPFLMAIQLLFFVGMLVAAPIVASIRLIARFV